MITFAAIKSSASLSLGVMEHPKKPGELFFFFFRPTDPHNGFRQHTVLRIGR